MDGRGTEFSIEARSDAAGASQDDTVYDNCIVDKPILDLPTQDAERSHFCDPLLNPPRYLSEGCDISSRELQLLFAARGFLRGSSVRRCRSGRARANRGTPRSILHGRSSNYKRGLEYHASRLGLGHGIEDIEQDGGGPFAHQLTALIDAGQRNSERAVI